MASNIVNFNLDQGSSLDIVIGPVRDQTGAIVNLSGCTVRAQVRRTFAAPAIINATLANGGLALTNAVGGIITWHIDHTQTQGVSGWETPSTETMDLVYDVEVTTTTGDVYKPARGTITLYREVTR